MEKRLSSALQRFWLARARSVPRRTAGSNSRRTRTLSFEQLEERILLDAAVYLSATPAPSVYGAGSKKPDKWPTAGLVGAALKASVARDCGGTGTTSPQREQQALSSAKSPGNSSWE